MGVPFGVHFSLISRFFRVSKKETREHPLAAWRGPGVPLGRAGLQDFRVEVCYACGSPGGTVAADVHRRTAPNRHRAWGTPVSAFGVSMKGFLWRAGAALGNFVFAAWF